MIVETAHGCVLLGPLRLPGEGEREMAWAEKHLRRDHDIGWVLGNYVEADNPNDNGHIFPLEDLTAAQQTLVHKPLNMLHQSKYIVGSFVAAELIAAEPATSALAAQAIHPVLEGLAAFWKHNFPEEYELVRRAHSEGAAFFSMEAVPKQIACVAEGCGLVADYVGRHSDTYCDHMTQPTGQKRLIQPHFNAGAIIVPPIRPGWKRADINEISQLVKNDPDLAESVYAGFEGEASHLAPKEWETMMAMVMLEARDFSTEQRQKMAKSGVAMSDGSFPIPDVDALKRAIRLAGNAKDPAAAKRHIIKRARALGQEGLIPSSWK